MFFIDFQVAWSNIDIVRSTSNQNFLWICPYSHYVLHNYKVLRNSVEQFQRSCADKLFQ